MKKFDKYDVWETMVDVLKHPLVPICLGVANLIFANGLAGVSIGLILIVAGIAEWMDPQ